MKKSRYSDEQITTVLKENQAGTDLPPLFRTVLGWDFPVMIPRRGDGESDEGIEVFGGADRFCSEAG